jgi:hypothetical protein
MKKKELFERISLLEEVVHNLSEKVETLLEPGENDTIIDGLVERIIDLETIVNAMTEAAETGNETLGELFAACLDNAQIQPEPNPELPKRSNEMRAHNDEIRRKEAPCPAPELPKQWEDLKSISGWYFSGECGLEPISNAFPTSDAKDVFASRKEAVSALAMAQLSQLMKVYRGGWVPVKGKSRYAIMPNFDDELCIYASVTRTSPLSFETEKIAAQFLNNFRPLINQYFMID